jgi:hypothetical protein
MRRTLCFFVLLGCRIDAEDVIDLDAVDPDAISTPAPTTEVADSDEADDAVEPAADSAVPVVEETGSCDPAAGWVALGFAFPTDAVACGGEQAVRFDATQGLYVGLVSCGDGFVRMYLSDNIEGPFLPALDLAGHGQDHCELIKPGFSLPNEDDIQSGGCPGCATGVNLPLEGVAGYARAVLGEQFQPVNPTGAWSWQTSRIDCDVDLSICVP